MVMRFQSPLVYIYFIKISNWSLFKLIISDQKLITFKMIFLPKYEQFNGQKFSSLAKKLSFNPQFFGG